MFGHQHLTQARAHCPRQTCSHLGLHEDKIPMIIFYELVDFIKAIRIKMFALYAELSFYRFGKELRFVGVCLGLHEWTTPCFIMIRSSQINKVS